MRTKSICAHAILKKNLEQSAQKPGRTSNIRYAAQQITTIQQIAVIQQPATTFLHKIMNKPFI